MKRLIVFLSFLLLSLAGNAQSGEKFTTTSFKVSGNCSMCKKRIEDAAFSKGVKAAEWNQKSGELTVTFRADKTSEEKIRQRIAGAGHDAGDVPANAKAYGDLPGCCQYRTESCNH